jgi:ankyrin repeat protein
MAGDDGSGSGLSVAIVRALWLVVPIVLAACRCTMQRWRTRPAFVEEQLVGGDDPDAGDRRSFTPLHFAAQQGAVEAARVLLDHGAQVDLVNVFGNSALSIAVFNSRRRRPKMRASEGWIVFFSLSLAASSNIGIPFPLSGI